MPFHERSPSPLKLSREQARWIWIYAQRLQTPEPFGTGPNAVKSAIEHLGYVQIDTINVIERCHHHILYSRMPFYQREHLRSAQSVEKSVFEYWTHALSYVPTRDFRFFIRGMKEKRKNPGRWFGAATSGEIRKILRSIHREGALTIRDISGEELIEKTHPWASKKPSKKALELAFYGGQVVIAERIGMLKKYELTERHFGWKTWPKAATEREILDYKIDRALRSQGLVSLDSIAYLVPSLKPSYLKLLVTREKRGELIRIQIEDDSKIPHWIRPSVLDETLEPPNLTHLLSPFDPLVIQRKRLSQYFGYEHRFEAYLPKEKRVYGYFALPVLSGDRIVALLDLKTDRAAQRLLIQKWTWLNKEKSKRLKADIEQELDRFERFQLMRPLS